MNKIIKIKNNNKNKNKRKIVIKYKNKRITLLSSTMHRFIITNVIKLGSPTYNNQNIQINLNEMIYQNPMFTQKRNEYQYFKLIRVMLRFTPVTRQGYNPPAGFIVFLGNEDMGLVNYTDLPYLSYKRNISNLKVSRHVFTRPGRQPDFNYWYNTTNFNAIDAYFKIRFDDSLDSGDGYYKLETGVEIIFDRPIYQSQDKTKEQEQIIKFYSLPSVEESPNTEIN
jgi:hypothetical protein